MDDWKVKDTFKKGKLVLSSLQNDWLERKKALLSLRSVCLSEYEGIVPVELFSLIFLQMSPKEGRSAILVEASSCLSHCAQQLPRRFEGEIPAAFRNFSRLLVSTQGVVVKAADEAVKLILKSIPLSSLPPALSALFLGSKHTNQKYRERCAEYICFVLRERICSSFPLCCEIWDPLLMVIVAGMSDSNEKVRDFSRQSFLLFGEKVDQNKCLEIQIDPSVQKALDIQSSKQKRDTSVTKNSVDGVQRGGNKRNVAVSSQKSSSGRKSFPASTMTPSSVSSLPTSSRKTQKERPELREKRDEREKGVLRGLGRKGFQSSSFSSSSSSSSSFSSSAASSTSASLPSSSSSFSSSTCYPSFSFSPSSFPSSFSSSSSVSSSSSSSSSSSLSTSTWSSTWSSTFSSSLSSLSSSVTPQHTEKRETEREKDKGNLTVPKENEIETGKERGKERENYTAPIPLTEIWRAGLNETPIKKRIGSTPKRHLLPEREKQREEEEERGERKRLFSVCEESRKTPRRTPNWKRFSSCEEKKRGGEALFLAGEGPEEREKREKKEGEDISFDLRRKTPCFTRKRIFEREGEKSGEEKGKQSLFSPLLDLEESLKRKREESENIQNTQKTSQPPQKIAKQKEIRITTTATTPHNSRTTSTTKTPSHFKTSTPFNNTHKSTTTTIKPISYNIQKTTTTQNNLSQQRSAVIKKTPQHQHQQQRREKGTTLPQQTGVREPTANSFALSRGVMLRKREKRLQI